MANPIPNLKFREFDANGAPLVGGQLFSYIAGTTTPLTTYSDPDGIVPNTNPVILDSSGRADVWLGARSYKFVLEDAGGSLIYTADNIDGTGSGGNSTAAWASHSVADGQSATALTGETVDGATYSSAIYDVEIKRGTTVFSNGTAVMQYLNSTWRVVSGLMDANEPNGVTFDVSQVGSVGTLRAALDSGAGDGTVKLSRRLVPA